MRKNRIPALESKLTVAGMNLDPALKTKLMNSNTPKIPGLMRL